MRRIMVILLLMWTCPVFFMANEVDGASENKALLALFSRPKVIPLLLDSERILLSELDEYVEIDYFLTPDRDVFFHESAERIWWVQKQPLLLLGATGEPLPSSVVRRVEVFVQIYVNGEPLFQSPEKIFPQREHIRIDKDAKNVSKVLSSAISINSTYLAQVANYLAGNLSGLDITAESYLIQNYGEVIDNQGTFVGRSAQVNLESVGFLATDCGTGVESTGAIFEGVKVSSRNDGIVVVEAGSGAPIGVESTGRNGIEIRAAEGHGAFVGRTGQNGMWVHEAGSDGLHIDEAGSSRFDPQNYQSSADNGVEIAAAKGVGVYVGATESSGILVNQTDLDGISINQAGRNGMTISHATNDGLHIDEAGSTSLSNFASTGNHGVEVVKSEDAAIYVGGSEAEGLYVGDAVTGVEVYNASTNAARLRSNSAGGGVNNATLHVTNINTGAAVGAYVETRGTDSSMVITQLGTASTSNFLKCYDNSYDLKVKISRLGGVFADAGFFSPAGDVAEHFRSENAPETYRAGDVISLIPAGTGKEGNVDLTARPYSPYILGVYPTKPALTLRKELDHSIPVGLLGVIPTNVTDEGGMIHIGDLLVSSSIPGMAMRADQDKVRPGMVIGRALTNQTSKVDLIDVLVGK